jgi:hypothetical protein
VMGLRRTLASALDLRRHGPRVSVTCAAAFDCAGLGIARESSGAAQRTPRRPWRVWTGPARGSPRANAAE